jgi:four helix bundle protein
MINSYKQLIVWQRSIELVEEVYKLTAIFPKEEMYGLISQIRRSAISIPSNIAEGRHRGSRKDFLQFLRIAYGSANELETQLIISKRLGYGKSDNYEKVESLLCEITKMLYAMIIKLNPKKAPEA